MKILFVLSNMTYPPVEGAHEQTLRVIDGLSKRGCYCAILIICKSKHLFDEVNFRVNYPSLELLRVFENKLSYSALLFVRTVQSFFKWNDDLRTELLNRQRDFDLIHAEGIPLAPLVYMKLKIPFILSVVDAWSLRQFRLGKDSGINFKAVARFMAAGVGLIAERFILQDATVVHVVSPLDARYLFRLNPKIVVKDISVALPAISDVEVLIERPNRASLNAQILVFSGDIRIEHIRKGLESFLENVFPKLLGDFPSLKLLLLCRAQPVGTLLNLVKSNDAVTVCAWVSDYALTIQSADVVVLPDSSGTGQKNRTVQALSLGVPVVGSPAAFEGIGIKNWVEGIVASNPDEFVLGIRALLTRPELAKEIAANARQLAISNFSLRVILERWDRLYRECLIGEKI